MIRVPLIRFAMAVFVLPSLGTATGADETPHIKRVVFTGMCDASAAAAIDGERFVVADDEDNVLRVYARDGGKALAEFDVSEFIGNQGKKKPKEADLEAAASIGSKTFWISSHGRNSKGKETPERQRLFATKLAIENGKVEVTPVGKPYRSLLDDLIAHPSLSAFHLAEAAQLAPKSPGGLNIEGLAATPDGKLLIGFRNPVPAGKALAVILENPSGVVAGGKAKLGQVFQLDLGGLGIRSIEYCKERYVIIAGVPGEGGQSKLFEWNVDATPRLISSVTLQGLNPEGIAFQSSARQDEYFILSDDGTRQVDGVDCKDMKDSSLKHFRGRFVTW